jgi:hypothetical protein
LFLVFILCSCASHESVFVVDKTALPYVKRFEQISNRRIKNLIVNVVYLEDKKLGECRPGRVPVINLNETYWYIHPYNRSQDRELLMFHELGHCILGRDHHPDTGSIMYRLFIGGNNYANNYGHYVSELFNINYTEGYVDVVSSR